MISTVIDASALLAVLLSEFLVTTRSALT